MIKMLLNFKMTFSGLLSTMVSLIFFNCHAQEKPEFAPIGTEWYFSYVIGSFYPDQGYAIERATNDTIIDGLPGKHIEKLIYSNRGNLMAVNPDNSNFIANSDDISAKINVHGR
jgi:hypothetical protein